MRGIRSAPRLTALMAGVLISLLIPAAADAAATKYAPNATARDFNQSAGGWTETTEPDALCLGPGVICPEVTNSRSANGGVGDSGYIESEISSVLSTILATNTGTWQSPEFTYNGAGGKKPKSLRFAMQMKSDLAQLLALPGNSATLNVSVVPAGGGQAVPVLEDQAIQDQAEFARLGDSLSPGDLQVGEDYSIEVATTFTTIAAVLPSGSVGYDNVVLTARRPGKGGGGGGGGSIGQQITKQIGNTVVLKGKRAKVRVGCPKAVKPGKCKLRVTGTLKRKGTKVTKTKRVNLRGGKHKAVRLKVTRKRRQIARRGRMFVRVKYVTPQGKGKVVKRVKVRSRR